MAANDLIKLIGFGEDGRDVLLPLFVLDMTWPPPETLEWCGHTWQRQRMSKLTDEQAEGMDFIARGAEYTKAEVAHG